VSYAATRVTTSDTAGAVTDATTGVATAAIVAAAIPVAAIISAAISVTIAAVVAAVKHRTNRVGISVRVRIWVRINRRRVGIRRYNRRRGIAISTTYTDTDNHAATGQHGRCS
jgi:hypothetical protein